MRHDGANNACGNSQRIMAPSGGGQAESFLWSSCSAKYLRKFLRCHGSRYIKKLLDILFVIGLGRVHA